MKRTWKKDRIGICSDVILALLLLLQVRNGGESVSVRDSIGLVFDANPTPTCWMFISTYKLFAYGNVSVACLVKARNATFLVKSRL